jgi:hypothetical protein
MCEGSNGSGTSLHCIRDDPVAADVPTSPEATDGPIAEESPAPPHADDVAKGPPWISKMTART